LFIRTTTDHQATATRKSHLKTITRASRLKML